jgi:hypothetical protein
MGEMESGMWVYVFGGLGVGLLFKILEDPCFFVLLLIWKCNYNFHCWESVVKSRDGKEG